MRMLSHAAGATRHGLTAIVEAALVAGIVLALVASVAVVTRQAPGGAITARAGSAGGAWITLATVDGRSAASVQPRLGDIVGFDTSYPRTIKNPRILVNCYQDGKLVFGMGGSVTYGFLLGGGGSIWLDKGGAADCVATLYYYGKDQGRQTFNPLADYPFTAGG